jgi:uncharacterized membrane protein
LPLRGSTAKLRQGGEPMKHPIKAAVTTAVLALAIDLAGSKAPASEASPPRPIPGVTFLGRATITQLSANGRAVVGEISDADGFHAVYWTQAGGLKPVRTRDGRDVQVNAISADGSTAAGCFVGGAGISHAFRWTEAGGVEDLGAPARACATAVSRDGSVIFGSLGPNASFRWTRATGVQDLHLPGVIWAASADGATAVGRWMVMTRDRGATHVFRWSLARGFEDLGAPPGTSTGANNEVRAEAMSADGSTIVGEYNMTRGFRWTRAGGFRDLPGAQAFPYAVSADGSQIVGQIVGGGGMFAVRWVGDGAPQRIGPPELKAVLANGISADGRTIAGRAGADPREWRAFVLRVR